MQGEESGIKPMRNCARGGEMGMATLREKSSVICVGPCVTVAELACRSGAVRRAQMSF